MASITRLLSVFHLKAPWTEDQLFLQASWEALSKSRAGLHWATLSQGFLLKYLVILTSQDAMGLCSPHFFPLKIQH